MLLWQTMPASHAGVVSYQSLAPCWPMSQCLSSWQQLFAAAIPFPNFLGLIYYLDFALADHASLTCRCEPSVCKQCSKAAITVLIKPDTTGQSTHVDSQLAGCFIAQHAQADLV